jgi:hypothetical protein
MNKKDFAKQGRLNRAAGARFELRVRKELEANGWITDKWTKNVDLESKELIAAKRKFNPFNKVMTIGTGFPDFIAFKSILDHKVDDFHAHKVIAVESKSNGLLNKKEKEKCNYLLENNIFKEILIAKKGEKRASIEYINFITKEIVSIF